MVVVSSLLRDAAVPITDVTVNVASSGWCVHFVVTSSQVPIGPWLLFESSEDIKGVTTPNVKNRALAIRGSPTRWMSESA
jgi:hypothetical protein